jgi:cytochrome c553
VTCRHPGEPSTTEAPLGLSMAVISRARACIRASHHSRDVSVANATETANADGPPLRTGPFAAYLVLRGQHASYLVSRLSDFHKGTPQQTTNDFIMHGVALSLDAASIQLIADWLDALPPGS